jgi:membrane peptidoglycan carboxypeptidase
VSISATSHTVTLTPERDFYGQRNVIYTARDPHGGSADSNLVILTVVKVEEPAGDYHIALLSAGLKGARTSPLHQAFVASIVENGGVAILPNLIARIETTEGRLIYSGEPIVLGRAISRKTADALKEMMVMTVTSGTASDRRYFRLLRRKHRDLKIGGKTGTLSQWLYPEGRCEWFVGFLEHRGRKLAFASIAVNGSRYVISGYELGAVIAMRFANSNSPAHD